MLKRFLFSAVFLVSASAANATILVTLQSGSPVSDGAGGFDWKYNVLLEAGAIFKPGDQFAIYDVGGLKSVAFEKDAGLVTSDTFHVTTPDTGPTLGFLGPTDLGSIRNAVVTLEGSKNIAPIFDPTTGVTPSLRLGTLTVDSSFGTATTLSTGSLTHAAGAVDQGFSLTTVAGPVPEPSTYGFMGIGLAAIAALAMRKTRREKN